MVSIQILRFLNSRAGLFTENISHAGTPLAQENILRTFCCYTQKESKLLTLNTTHVFIMHSLQERDI
jgi:hypothetical protein